MNRYERDYRKAGRVTAALFLLFVPFVGSVGFGLDKFFSSSLLLFIVAGVWMAVSLVFSVRVLWAYWCWRSEGFPKT